MPPTSGFRLFLSTIDPAFFARFESLRESTAGQLDFELFWVAPQVAIEQAKAGDMVVFDLGAKGDRAEFLPAIETSESAFFVLYLIPEKKELCAAALEKMCGGFVLPRENFESSLVLNLRSLFQSAFGKQLFSIKKAIIKPENGVGRDHFFIRHRKMNVRVEVSDILWVKAAGSAVEIVTRRDRLAASMNLNSFLAQTQSQQLRRVHRSFAVNESAVSGFDSAFVYVAHPSGPQAIPVGEGSRNELFERLKKLRAD